jgi:hypothetical protein
MLSAIGCLLAVLLMLLMLFLQMNSAFIGIDSKIIGILRMVKEWATIILIVIVGMEAAVKKGFIVFIIFAALAAALVIFTFFPGSIESIMG